jgi:N-methylhydantoinase B
MASLSAPTMQIDPITFEVLRNALVAAVDEMGLMLEKVAFSMVVSEGRDFSTSISDATGNLVADGTQDLPGHIGTIPFTTKGVIEHIGLANLRPGDIILMNDPFIGGTHCQDARTVMPVFNDRELIAFVQASAHWVDAGGAVPGSFQVDARSPYEEALYIPPIHLVREGEVDESVLRLILRNVRVPEVTTGDIAAMIEACRAGDLRVRALCEKYGLEILRAQMARQIDHSRTLLEHHFESLPDGTYAFTDYIDYDPCAPTRDPLPVTCSLKIAGSRATFDFSESAPQARGAINAPRSLLWSAVVVATKSVFPDVAVNQGLFDAIDVVAPDGLLVTAVFPAPVSGAFATCYEKITSATHGCYLQVAPERAMVACGNICNIVVGGYDSREGYGRDYVMYNWLEGGYGARPAKRDNHTAMSLFCSGTQNQPIERAEYEYPIMFERYALVADSAGPGRHRGGLGVAKNFWVTHGDATVSVLGDRELTPSWGAGGGKRANLGNQLIYRAGESDEQVIGMKRSGVPVEAQHLLTYWQGGGGGYGSPAERRPEWVLEDVVNGYVSIEGARKDYLVEIKLVDETAGIYEIDAETTARLRSTND